MGGEADIDLEAVHDASERLGVRYEPEVIEELRSATSGKMTTSHLIGVMRIIASYEIEDRILIQAEEDSLKIFQELCGNVKKWRKVAGQIGDIDGSGQSRIDFYMRELPFPNLPPMYSRAFAACRLAATLIEYLADAVESAAVKKKRGGQPNNALQACVMKLKECFEQITGARSGRSVSPDGIPRKTPLMAFLLSALSDHPEVGEDTLDGILRRLPEARPISSAFSPWAVGLLTMVDGKKAEDSGHLCPSD